MDDYTLYDKIESYLKGALSLEETKKFEQDMSNNPQLAEMVKMHRFEWDAMEVLVENDLRDQMAKWDKENVSPPSVKEIEKSPFLGNFKNRRLYYGLAAAASVALLIAITIWFFREPEKVKTDVVKSNTEKDNHLPHDTAVISPTLPKDQTEKDKPIIVETYKKRNNKTKPLELPSEMSTTDDKAYIALAETAYDTHGAPNYEDMNASRGSKGDNTILDEVGKDFDKKEFNKTIMLLRNTPVTDENFTALEVLAHAYFQNKNYKAALPVFQNLLKLSGKKSHDKSEWYLLLCYLANYNQHTSDFKTLANKILDNKEHGYFDETTQLLKQVNGK